MFLSSWSLRLGLLPSAIVTLTSILLILVAVEPDVVYSFSSSSTCCRPTCSVSWRRNGKNNKNNNQKGNVFRVSTELASPVEGGGDIAEGVRVDDGQDTQKMALTENEGKKMDEDQFDWYKSWYPLVPAEILDPEKPHRFQLLGMALVVWNDQPVEGHDKYESKSKRPRGVGKKGKGRKSAEIDNSRWRVFVDECPHRKVPLSEGRVEDDGSLLCSYHGWRFDGSGSCIEVPQIGTPSSSLSPSSSKASKMTPFEAVLNNPKSRCASFPTQVVDGILFVWPSSDENAVLESALTLPNVNTIVGGERSAISSETIDKDRLWIGPWNYRELPYGADYFIENVVDPAHVPVSHHNIVGNRYGNRDDKLLELTTVKPVSKSGFAVKSTTPGRTDGLAVTTFHAPSLVLIDTEVKLEEGAKGKGHAEEADDDDDGVAKQILELHCSPSRPGFCNHIGRQVIVKTKSGKTPMLLRVFQIPMPKWLNHIAASAFLNQDALFLHYQERHLARTGQYRTYSSGQDDDNDNNYSKAVLPVSADKGVIHFRNWMERKAGKVIPYMNPQRMPPPSEDVVFDVYNAHTKHCSYCQDALRNLKKARFLAFLASACVGVLRPSKLGGPAPSLALSLVLAGSGLIMNKLVGMFYRYEYSHADND